ncbi:MAG: GH25 family lysozyme [Pirellulales bacterium]
MSASRNGAREFFLVAAAALTAVLVTGTHSAAQQRALGLDISAWQGDISQGTWDNFRDDENRQFVFLRSSRGGTTGYYNQSNAGNNNPPGQNTLSQRYDDPYFVQNINRATTAGMYAGSYHFSRPDIIASTLNSNGIPNSGTDEANHFMQMAGPWMRPGYLLPVHDFEAGDGARSDDAMAQFSIDFSNRVHEVMGIRPAIYVSGNYAHYVLGGASASLRDQVVAAYPTLWSARWPNQDNPNAIDVQNGHPKDSISYIYGPWDDYGDTHPWHFWQYTSRGRLQSFNNGGSNLDMNVAQGGVEYLKDHLVPALWMNDSSGQWTTLANWNSGQTPVAPVQGPGQVARVGTLTLPTPRLPGAAGSGVTSGQHDTVILDRPNANITVTLSSGSHNIRKLYVREAFNIIGGALTVNYAPSPDSTPISAQFSEGVIMSGNASLSVHTLQVDATRTFTLGGGTLSLNTINLMPHSTTPAKIAMAGNVNFNPLAGAAAVIANGAGAGTSGYIDLGGVARTFNVGNGAAAHDLSINVPIINGALTKSGAGALALDGANTYAGNTTVLAGQLSIGSAFLWDTADVFLSSGATLDLNFGGDPDVIDSFFVNGVSQAVGTWGAAGNVNADFQSPFLTGTGLLQVTTAPLAGDYNQDGTVDAADYLVWRNNVGSGTSLANDDTPGVGPDDLARWQANFGQAVGTGLGLATNATIPEPTTVALLAIAAGMLMLVRVRGFSTATVRVS